MDAKQSTTDWGTILHDLRMEKGLTEREVCAALDMNRTTLRRCERNRSNDIRRIERLLSLYGYGLDAMQEAA